VPPILDLPFVARPHLAGKSKRLGANRAPLFLGHSHQPGDVVDVGEEIPNGEGKSPGGTGISRPSPW
jgi:hypothetical protein